MSDDPTTREVMIELRGVAKAMADLTAEVRSLTQNTVPRGEFVIARDADARRIAELEKRLDGQDARGRQFTASLAVGALLFLAQFVVTVSGALPGGGS